MSIQKPASPWNYKPWWCQPWSILLTGTTIIISSWLLLKNIWITVIVSIPCLIWMCYFVLIWPRMISHSGALHYHQEQPPE